MQRLFILTTIISFFLFSCKKPDPINSGSNGLVKSKGTPVGIASSQTIGPAGGSIISPDNVLTITVPAGAVASNTAFSIQPITNTTPNGIGNGYRLLPEGTQFALPVTLTYHYPDSTLEGSQPEDLGIATQDSKGIWHTQDNIQLDANNKTIRTTAIHFSDWNIYTAYRLYVRKPTIDFNESTDIFLWHVQVAYNNNNEHVIDGEEVSLLQTAWSKDAEGTLNGSSSGTATYTAPSFTPNPNPVTIIAQVHISQGVDAIYRRKIYVASSFFEVTLDLGTNIYPNCTAVVYPGLASVTAHNNAGHGVDVRLPMSGTGTFQYGVPANFGNWHFNIGGVSFTDNYSTCYPDPIVLKYTPGTVTITKWSTQLGDYIEGRYVGQVVNVNNCTFNIKSTEGRFRAKVAF